MAPLLRIAQRRGFTVIELLVVIAIIGILLALILPSVQSAREAARRVACTNNLKNLSLAAHSYHDCHLAFPPGALGPLGPMMSQFADWKHHGMGTFLLPYIEQQPLASHYNWDVSWFDPPNQAVVNVPMAVWLCPSAPGNRVHDGALSTIMPPPRDGFVGTASCGDYAGMASIDPGLENSGLIDRPRGHRDPRGHITGAFPVNGVRRMAEFLDGTSQTILMAECAGRPQLWRKGTRVSDTWVSGGPWSSRSVLWCRGASPDGTAFFGTCAVNCTNDRAVYGFHPGGAGSALVDGSVRFLNESLDIRIFAALVTPAGGEVVSFGDY